MPYTIDTYREPFWAKSGNFVRGRDPLGVQNSSISVYATLLPGMTNLTLRLRYYGMYLWLLDEYHNLPSDNAFKQSPKAQYTFIRRAELITAFVMVNNHPKELSVIGTDFASRNIGEVNSKGFYDIALGADQNKDTVKGSVYWDYVSGALGQYYAGSLLALNLINVKNDFFERSEEYGKVLAESYKKSLSINAALLFLKRIDEGKLYLEDLELLDEIALNKDCKNTPEGAFYFKMLLSDDGIKSKTVSQKISSQRRESLHLFLKLINDEEENLDIYDLPVSSYLSCLNKDKNEVSEAGFGWYYYYLNELAHFSLEAVFWGMLCEMDKGNYSLEQFLFETTKKVYYNSQVFLGDHTDSLVSDLLTKLNQDDFVTLDYIDKIKVSVKSNNSLDGIVQGIFTLLCLYRDNQKMLSDVRHYAIDHFLDSKYGNALQIFQSYIETSHGLKFEDFVRKFIHNLLNEHIAVAYNKMGNGEKNLLKFVVEDNYLVHIETMRPNFTNPRLRTLLNFTKDLGLVGIENKLTESGKELLQELNNVE
jgi:hypothetical protein